jgi:hypothetical protein
MNSIVLASVRPCAGKTTLALGTARNYKKKIGYMKPFGDRLMYKKKRLWDQDAATFTRLFGLNDRVEDLSIGFDQSKLSYMFDEKTMGKRVKESFERVSKNKDFVFLEAGHLFYGASVHLDAFSLAEYTDSPMVFVLSGSGAEMLDEMAFLKKHVDCEKVKGVVFNKVKSPGRFKQEYGERLEELDVKNLGVIPHEERLETMSARFLADNLFARVVAGEKGLDNEIDEMFIGALSASAALKNPLFKEKNKLIITGGDRSDMIVAAIQHDTSCLILTNDILPPANIIAKADHHGVPLLSVKGDTYTVAKKVENLQPAMSMDEEKLGIVEKLVGKNVDWKKLVD